MKFLASQALRGIVMTGKLLTNKVYAYMHSSSLRCNFLRTNPLFRKPGIRIQIRSGERMHINFLNFSIRYSLSREVNSLLCCSNQLNGLVWYECLALIGWFVSTEIYSTFTFKPLHSFSYPSGCTKCLSPYTRKSLFVHCVCLFVCLCIVVVTLLNAVSSRVL